MSATQRNRILRRLSGFLRVVVKFRKPLRHLRHQHVPKDQTPGVLMDVSDQHIPAQKGGQETDARRLSAQKSHNERQLVSQLPNELLFQIFLKGVLPRHAAIYPALLRKYCDTKRYLGQVCHRWRELALECPDMWCNAVDLSAGIWWTLEVLRRSRDRPVTVFMPQGAKEQNFALVVRTQKIRALFANVQQPYLARRVLDHLRDLRCLEELDFIACSQTRSRLREALENWTRDASTTPLSALRCLYLTGPSIPLPTHRMPTLTCLYVTHSWGSKTASEWLIALRNFSNLQELSLINCIQPDCSTIGADDVHFSLLSDLTTLPHLRELELTGNHGRCGTVFRGIVIPPTCILRMATNDVTVGPSLDAVVNFLKSSQPSCHTLPPCHKNRSLCFKATSSQLYVQVSEEEVVKLDIHLKFGDKHYGELAATALATQALLSATLSRFRRYGGFSTLNIALAKLLAANSGFSHWLRLIHAPLSMLQEIQTLRLQEITTVRALMKPVETETSSSFKETHTSFDEKSEPPTPSSYPLLRQITFSHVEFSRQRPSFVLDYIASFISRHPNIRRTRFTQCKHIDGVVDKIRSLGVEVFVD